MQRRSILRLISINLLVLAGTLIVILASVEGWARFYPRNMFVQFDPHLGFRLEPNAEGIYSGLSFLSPNPAINVPIRINSMGLRGPERSFDKPRDTRRVLMIGDSFVQAFEVRYEETFYSLLEAYASTSEGPHLEAIPMGVMSYGTAQELLWLRDMGVKFEPDLIILVVYLGNDISDNSKALLYTQTKPYFTLQDGALSLTDMPGRFARVRYWLAKHLRSYLVLREVIFRLVPLRQTAIRLGLVNRPMGNDEKEGNRNRIRRDAFDLTFALIREIVQTAKKAGSDFGIAYSGKTQTGLNMDSDTLFEQFCEREALDCLSLNPALDSDELNFVPNDDHWSAKGHQVVADLFWRRWIDRLASSAPPSR